MPLQTSSTRARPSVRRQQHDAVCTNCDAVTSLPFRPTPGRPVYCRPCFRNRRGGAAPSGGAPATGPGCSERTPRGCPRGRCRRVFRNGATGRDPSGARGHGHRGADAHSGTDHPPSAGRTRPDRSGAHGVRQDPRIRGPGGRAMRSIDAEGPGFGTGADARAGHSGGRGRQRPGCGAEVECHVAVWRPVGATGASGVEARSPHRRGNAGPHAGPPATGQPGPAIGTISCPRRSGRDAGQGFRPRCRVNPGPHALRTTDRALLRDHAQMGGRHGEEASAQSRHGGDRPGSCCAADRGAPGLHDREGRQDRRRADAAGRTGRRAHPCLRQDEARRQEAGETARLHGLSGGSRCKAISGRARANA